MPALPSYYPQNGLSDFPLEIKDIETFHTFPQIKRAGGSTGSDFVWFK